jgi:hypothetical protein
MSASEERIKVLARIRPLNSKEEARNDTRAIDTSSSKSIQLESIGANLPRRFMLDAVLDENTSQEQIFSEISPLLDRFVNGYNCTVFTCESQTNMIVIYFINVHALFRWPNWNREDIYDAWL